MEYRPLVLDPKVAKAKAPTPVAIAALVSKTVTQVVDRITGDRTDYPLLVALACVEALQYFGIDAQIHYGHAAWIEVLEDHRVIWSGCWGDHFSFWVQTASGETIDLNTSAATRKKAHSQPEWKALYSAPILWASRIPLFYRYHSQGVAEVELTEERDLRWFRLIQEELKTYCRPETLSAELSGDDFPNEAMLCPDFRILDDGAKSFQFFDRALSIAGIPEAPFHS